MILGNSVYTSTARPILVYDKRFDSNKSFLDDWLKSEGFRYVGFQSYIQGCPLIYFDITHKLYTFGLPGIEISMVFRDHAITLKEFFTIYNIYKKYEGKEMFTFHNKRFDPFSDE